jgi:predicted ATPase
VNHYCRVALGPAVHIIYRIMNATFSADPNLFLILALTAMRWTVKYGVSKYSPPMISVYGLVVCGLLEDFEHDTMIGEVALALSEKLQVTQTIAMTTQVTFSASTTGKMIFEPLGSRWNTPSVRGFRWEISIMLSL